MTDKKETEKRTVFWNWAKTARGLRETGYALSGVVEYHMGKLHDSITKSATKKNGNPELSCTKCNEESLLPLHAKGVNCKCKDCFCNRRGKTQRVPCPLGEECSIVYNEIVESYYQDQTTRYPKHPTFDNVRIPLLSTKKWEFVRAFIDSRGYKKVDAAAEGDDAIDKIDASGLIAICLNAKCIRSNLDEPGRFEEVRNSRNKIFHSGDLNISEDEMKYHLKRMTELLNDSGLKGYQYPKDIKDCIETARKNIEKMPNEEFCENCLYDIDSRNDAIFSLQTSAENKNAELKEATQSGDVEKQKEVEKELTELLEKQTMHIKKVKTQEQKLNKAIETAKAVQERQEETQNAREKLKEECSTNNWTLSKDLDTELNVEIETFQPKQSILGFDKDCEQGLNRYDSHDTSVLKGENNTASVSHERADDSSLQNTPDIFDGGIRIPDFFNIIDDIHNLSTKTEVALLVQRFLDKQDDQTANRLKLGLCKSFGTIQRVTSQTVDTAHTDTRQTLLVNVLHILNTNNNFVLLEQNDQWKQTLWLDLCSLFAVREDMFKNAKQTSKAYEAYMPFGWFIVQTIDKLLKQSRSNKTGTYPDQGTLLKTSPIGHALDSISNTHNMDIFNCYLHDYVCCKFDGAHLLEIQVLQSIIRDHNHPTESKDISAALVNIHVTAQHLEESIECCRVLIQSVPTLCIKILKENKDGKNSVWFAAETLVEDILHPRHDFLNACCKNLSIVEKTLRLPTESESRQTHLRKLWETMLVLKQFAENGCIVVHDGLLKAHKEISTIKDLHNTDALGHIKVIFKHLHDTERNTSHEGCDTTIMSFLSKFIFENDTADVITSVLKDYVIGIRKDVCGIIPDQYEVVGKFVLLHILKTEKDHKWLKAKQTMSDSDSGEKTDLPKEMFDTVYISTLEDAAIIELETDTQNQHLRLEKMSKTLDSWLTDNDVDQLAVLASARAFLKVTADILTDSQAQTFEMMASFCKHDVHFRMYFIKYLVVKYGVSKYEEVCCRPSLQWLFVPKEELFYGEDCLIVHEALGNAFRGTNEKFDQIVHALENLPTSQKGLYTTFAIRNKLLSMESTEQVLNGIGDCLLLQSKKKIIRLKNFWQSLGTYDDVHHLIFHFVAVMNNVEAGNTCLQFIKRLMNGETAQAEYIPTMPEDEFPDEVAELLASRDRVLASRDRVLALRDTSYLAYLAAMCRNIPAASYSCANGHPMVANYVATAPVIGIQCHVQNCQESLAFVGVRRSKMPIGEPDSGHVIGRKGLLSSNMKIRDMTPLACCTLRLLLHLAMFAGCGEYEHKIRLLIYPPPTNVKAFLWDHICHGLSEIMKLASLSNLEESLAYANMCISNIFKESEGETQTFNMTMLSTREARQTWETKFCETFFRFGDWQEEIKQYGTKLRLDFGNKLCQSHGYLPGFTSPLIHIHFSKIRDCVSVREFQHSIPEEFGLLKAFMEKRGVVKHLQFIPRLLEKQEEIRKYCETIKSSSDDKTFSKVIQGNDPATSGLKPVAQEFIEVWNSVNNARRNAGEINKTDEINGDFLIENLILGDQKPHNLGVKVVQYLLETQNQLVKHYSDTICSKHTSLAEIPIPSVHPRKLTNPVFLISFNNDDGLRAILLKHSKYVKKHEYYDEIQYDYAAIERDIGEAFLATAYKIKLVDLHEIYKSQTPVLTLGEVVKQEQLATDQKKKICREMRIDRAIKLVSAIQDAIKLMSAIGGNPDDYLCVAFKALGIQVNVTKSIRMECKLKHTDSLYLLLLFQISKQKVDDGHESQDVFDTLPGDLFHVRLLFLTKLQAFIEKLSSHKLAFLTEVVHGFIISVVQGSNSPNTPFYEGLQAYVRKIHSPSNAAIASEFPQEDILYKHAADTWITIYRALRRTSFRRK